MTDTNQHLSSKKFTDFPLPDALLKAIDDLGYQFCTPIQANTLPVILENKNIIGQAETGTGKTATFLIATIHSLLRNSPREGNNHQPRALILAPTRELAIQIFQEAEALTKYCDLKTRVVYGGANYVKQKQQMSQHCDILIATVGRVIDFHKQHLMQLKYIETLVLDEADRMLDMGFIKDVRYLIRKLPPAEKRLNLLFSATINYKVKEFAYELMNDPQIISVEHKNTEPSIEQIAYYVSNDEKIAVLIGLINALKPERAIVFANMKSTAENVTAFLASNDISAELLSGDVPQKKRQKLVETFGAGKFNVLVATDVAARGIHVDSVTHVFNYDLPQDPEDYVHRIGRTGRIGSSGHAINLVCESYAFYLPEIESFTGKKIPMESISQDLIAEVKPRAPRKRKPFKNAQKKSGNRQQRSRHKPNTSRGNKN